MKVYYLYAVVSPFFFFYCRPLEVADVLSDHYDPLCDCNLTLIVVGHRLPFLPHHLQNLSSRLAHLVAEENLCHSFQAFHSSYCDTGLLGIYFVVDKHNIDDMMHLCQNAWSVARRTHL